MKTRCRVDILDERDHESVISSEWSVLPDCGQQPQRAIHWTIGLPWLLRDFAGPQQRHVSINSFNEIFMFGFIKGLVMFYRLPWLPGATPKSWETVVDGCYLAPYITNGPWSVSWTKKREAQ